MTRLLLVACCVCGLILSHAPSSVAANEPSAMDKAFQWFDSLDLVDFKQAKVVRVATGTWSTYGGGSTQREHVLAFLLKDDPPHFTVFTTDLRTETYIRTAVEVPELGSVGYEPLNLAIEAVAMLESLRVPYGQDAPWLRFGHMVPKEVEVFAMARACAANGLDKPARELYEQAVLLARKGSGGKPPVDFQTHLYEKIADTTMWRAVLAFGHPQTSRERLLEEFNRFLKHFPSSEHAQRARDTVAMLEKMVAEDREHAARSADELAAMPVTERVAELIFQLRDQNGQQWSQPGACDIFGDSRGKQSPAMRLVAVGYDAIPQLIETLGDQRFTRSVGYHRSFYFSHHVLRVGDCAGDIISRITRRNFCTPRSPIGAAAKDAEVADTRKAVKEWWAEFQEKGEKRMLIEGTARGDADSPHQARTLLDRYPDAALDALTEGIRKAGDPWPRNGLIGVLERIEGDGPVPLLIEILNKDASWDCRVSAATALHVRGRDEGVRAIIELWKQATPPPDATAWGNPERRLADFLVSCGSPEAVRTLAKDLSQRSVDVRLDVIFAVSDNAHPPDNTTSLQNKDVRAAMEELLVAALGDTESREGMSGGRGDWNFRNPRICDAAGHALSQGWPAKYTFDANAGRKQRDRQRIEAINVWRKERGETLLPLPQPVVIEPAAPSVIDRLMAALLEARRGPARTRAAEAIEALGLPALGPVHARLQSLAPGDRSRPEFEQLARNLSCIVREVVVKEGSVQPAPPFQELLDAAKGRPLTAKAFVRLMCEGVRHLPQEAVRLRIRAERDESMTGLTLEIELKPGVRPSGGVTSTGYSECVEAGTEALLSSSGGGSLSYWLNPESHNDLAKSISKALESAADCPLLASVSVRLAR